LRKEELWEGEFWSDGKDIGTVGDATNEEVIKRYIGTGTWINLK
jgi:REP element-mobilizing transposase RayT